MGRSGFLLPRSSPRLTPTEVAKRLDCTAPTVRKYIRDGYLPAYRTYSRHPNGARYEVDPDELERFIALYSARRVVSGKPIEIDPGHHAKSRLG